MAVITSKYFQHQAVASDKEELRHLETEVQEALEHDPYDKEVIPVLEHFVQEQVSNKVYNFEANVALLKLYQLFPNTYNTDIVVKIATKALMNLPETDYFLTIALLPPALLELDSIKHLTAQFEKLEMARFTEFWAENNEYVESVPGFFDAIRAYIVSVICITFESVSRSVLKEALNVDDGRLKELIEAEGWDIDEDGGILVTPNDQNQILPKKFKENIEFNQILNVINKN